MLNFGSRRERWRVWAPGPAALISVCDSWKACQEENRQWVNSRWRPQQHKGPGWPESLFQPKVAATFWPSLWGIQCLLGPGVRPPETPPSGQVRLGLAKGWGLVSQNGSPHPTPALPEAQGLMVHLFIPSRPSLEGSGPAGPEGSGGQRRCPLSVLVPTLSPAHRSSCSPQLSEQI